MAEPLRVVRPASSAPLPIPDPIVRNGVKELLQSTKAFNALPPDRQQQVARDTAIIADYLARPEGFNGNELEGGVARTAGARALADAAAPQVGYTEAREAVSEIGTSDFRAGAAREGAEVAADLIKKVDFVGFVGGLIKGVFSSIVASSIQQMEAYSKMVEQVAKSLQQFRDDNVSMNQGRDHMVDKFPDLFEVDQGGGEDGGFSESTEPRLKLKDGVDEDAALKRVRTSMKFEDGKLDSMDLSDENVEKVLVIAAQTQLARQRQQLLASLVIMGINRIVVTEGKISAKVMYDFQARDARKLQRSATARDYARDAGGNLSLTRSREGEYDYGGKYSGEGDKYDADYFSKGKYKYEEQPVLTAMSTASEASESQLQTRAQLSGAVEVNFKSDYLPLEKMATPGMMAAIQGNSTPVDPNVVPSVRQQPAAAAPPAAAPPAAAPPAAAGG